MRYASRMQRMLVRVRERQLAATRDLLLPRLGHRTARHLRHRPRRSAPRGSMRDPTRLLGARSSSRSRRSRCSVGSATRQPTATPSCRLAPSRRRPRPRRPVAGGAPASAGAEAGVAESRGAGRRDRGGHRGADARSLGDGANPRQPGGRGSCCATAPRSRSPTTDGGRETETVRVRRLVDSGEQRVPRGAQFWVVGPLHTRRCDIVCFVNGIPLVLLELKASHKTVEQAYRQEPARLPRHDPAALHARTPSSMLSNGSETKVGATFAPWEQFAEWKRIDDEAEPGVVSLETAIHGHVRAGPPARYRRELRRLYRATGRADQDARPEPPVPRREHRDPGARATSARATGELGVFWHTQGSGKSLSMLFFTQKVLRREPGNWTFVMVTDRAELDDQIYGEFKDAGVGRGARAGRRPRRTCASCSARTTATSSR